MSELRTYFGPLPGAEQERVITAMITPFDTDGRLNYDGAQELAAWLVGHGSDGLVLAGTTGESPTLLADEQLDLFDVVREAVGDEVLLIAGTGSNSTEEAVALTRAADRRESVDGFLVVSPYYNKPSQFGIGHYYREVGAVTERPVMLYNIPGRTGRLVELDTVSRLAEDSVVTAVKDATGNTAMAKALHGRFGGDLAIFSGDDGLNLDFARVGAAGGVSVASHWAGREIGQMFRAYFSGDEARAERIQAALEPSAKFESSHTDEAGTEHDTPNPIPTKVMMAHVLGAGVVGDCLPPMIAAPGEMRYLRARAPEILANLAAAMGHEAAPAQG
jgi:4-hydroxy-tetrahydrodipicolinate synthase